MFICDIFYFLRCCLDLVGIRSAEVLDTNGNTYFYFIHKSSFYNYIYSALECRRYVLKEDGTVNFVNPNIMLLLKYSNWTRIKFKFLKG